MTPSEPLEPPPTFRLKFLPQALEEWNSLDESVKETLRKLLKKRLQQPRLPGSELHGNLKDCYKIKLRKQGYRLVYQVQENILVVLVLAVDKREDMALRLRDALGTSAEMWATMQAQYDLWQAEQKPRPKVVPFSEPATA